MPTIQFSKLYVRMTAYLLAMIGITLLGATMVFFLTVGKPMAKHLHAMLRSHANYMESLMTDLISEDVPPADIEKAINRFSESYGFLAAVMDEENRMLFATATLQDRPVVINSAMREDMEQKGIFVQRSHFSQPLIYVLPLKGIPDRHLFLYLTRAFPGMQMTIPFTGGLALIAILLMLAAYPLSKSITRPISDLKAALNQISKGHFDHMPVYRRKDEIGELFRGYQEMSRSVNAMIQSKKQLLADISHELCSPLGRIRVAVELIKDSSSDERSIRYLKNIENDIVSMDRLIGSLAAFSRMNLPGFQLSPGRFHPGELIDHVYRQYLPLVKSRGLSLDIRANDTFPEMAFDFERLKQVYSNLLDNALRFSEPGQTIRIGAFLQNKNVCFFVEDQGPGIPEESANRIFEPLYRVDAARNQQAGCAGLGLAISRSIMTHHQGTLTYKRENNHTRFIFCLNLPPNKKERI